MGISREEYLTYLEAVTPKIGNATRSLEIRPRLST